MKSKRDTPMTVLVVKDEPTVRELAESIVENSGYRTLSAATAREAIALLEQDEPIDLLFTDINLPDGPEAMDGLELARQAVELRPRLRVIYTTGGGRTDGMTALFVDGGIFSESPIEANSLFKPSRPHLAQLRAICHDDFTAVPGCATQERRSIAPTPKVASRPAA
jgi:CheY-like chemotaxis protein